VWSRDGRSIAYRISAESSRVMVQRANGLEPERTAAESGSGATDIKPNSWSVDQQEILCTRDAEKADLVLVSVRDGTLTPFLSGKASTSNGQISPDGKWVAYTSNESGDWETYVTTFPGATGKWQISRGGGTEPRWRGDGKEIFYVGHGGTLMAAHVDTTTTFSSTTPAALFPIRGRAPISSTDIFSYDVAKDGQRFLVNRYVRPEQVLPLTIVLHATWKTKQ
jgi:Tol biopolymer transport system component